MVFTYAEAKTINGKDMIIEDGKLQKKLVDHDFPWEV